jgi:hypothetical protein
MFSAGSETQTDSIGASSGRTEYSYDSLNRRTDEYQYLGGSPCSGASFTRACINGLTPPGAPTSTTGPLSFTDGALQWQTSYDPNGNVSLTVDPKAQQCVHTFGLLNRLSSARTTSW